VATGTPPPYPPSPAPDVHLTMGNPSDATPDLNVPLIGLFAKLARENRVPLTVWRAGKQLRVMLPVSTRDTRVIPYYAGEPLAYFIHGPLVFAPARADDISIYAQLNRNLYTDNSPLVNRRFEFVAFPGEELVVVSAPMFKHKLGKGKGK